MIIEQKDVVIIGGGPAGLAAAVRLHESGIRSILLLEREKELGGILRQCIHDGFGLTRFGESLSGPEYAKRFIDQVFACGTPFRTGASVIDVSSDRLVTYASPQGMGRVQAKAVVFAMGCRERTRGMLGIPGERPAGVFTAGTAQAYINLYNRKVGRRIVILGSGDIGMIMARRLTLEGAKVHAVYEIRSVPSGLPRNIQQCLHDYNIPLYLSRTITEIHGSKRVTGVTTMQVDQNLRPIPGTEKYVSCDTVILSAGLIPENELTQAAGIELDGHTQGAVVDEYFQTGKPGFFAAGNVLHVHDLVDFVSAEAETLAASVAEYLQHGFLPLCPIAVEAGTGIGHVLPQRISGRQPVTFSLRVSRPLENTVVTFYQGDRILAQKKLKKALPAEMLTCTMELGKHLTNESIEVRAQ